MNLHVTHTRHTARGTLSPLFGNGNDGFTATHSTPFFIVTAVKTSNLTHHFMFTFLLLDTVFSF
jgi:hypothetical protein